MKASVFWPLVAVIVVAGIVGQAWWYKEDVQEAIIVALFLLVVFGGPILWWLARETQREHQIHEESASRLAEVKERQAAATADPKLTPCPDCGRQVSRLAESCPQCGRPLTPGKAGADSS